MNASAYRPVAAAALSRGGWPKVSLHLPLRDAPPEAVRRTLDSVAALDWPSLEVLVVDTHTANPAWWEAAAEYCALLGPQFRFFHLGAWPGFRAGALNFALGETAADATVVGVLGAGQVVRPDWLRAAVPLLDRTGIGLAQAPLLPPDPEPGPALLLPLDGLTLFRADALRHAGGWDTGSLCPEATLGVTLMQHGWDSALLAAPMGYEAPIEDEEDATARRHRRVAGTVMALRSRVPALLLPRNRSLTPAQRGGLLRALLPPLGHALALAAVVASLGLALLALWDDDAAAPLPAVLAVGLAALMPLALAGRSAGWIWRSGRAAWQGLLGGGQSHPAGLGLERLLVAALWTAAAGLAVTRPWGTGGTLMVSAMLVAQSVPGLLALWPPRRARRLGWRHPA